MGAVALKSTNTENSRPTFAVLAAAGQVLPQDLAFGDRDNFVSLSALRQRFALSAQDAARLAGLSLRSWATVEATDKNVQKAKTETLQASLSMMRKLAEMQALLSGLAALMPSLTVGGWLKQPSEYFQELSPLEIVERGQIHRLWALIHHANAGEPV